MLKKGRRVKAVSCITVLMFVFVTLMSLTVLTTEVKAVVENYYVNPSDPNANDNVAAGSHEAGQPFITIDAARRYIRNYNSTMTDDIINDVNGEKGAC